MTTWMGGQLYRVVRTATLELRRTSGLTAIRLVCHPGDPQRADLVIIADRLNLELVPRTTCEPGTLYVLPRE